MSAKISPHRHGFGRVEAMDFGTSMPDPRPDRGRPWVSVWECQKLLAE